ncbi:STAS domain-containing protein [Velocimicrobium porci]|uniref:Anti-sigma factor antagonist n=1 Tax=Velocimicrobium porci TaxID=2606634 RepID=A0A6L5XXN0_9FIRM|nr:anti-sigma factor antagonist [Velocimicrobium porci]MSS63515.1 anti-sigma factor antagonist [Velocimicrobium porci]
MKTRKKIDSFFEVDDACLIIHITDDLDHHNVISLREKADRLIDKERVKNIVFDFDGVSFMDSSGIGMIMGRYKKVIFTGGKVGVASVSNNVDRIFRISGLYKIIGKYETVAEAVQAL